MNLLLLTLALVTPQALAFVLPYSPVAAARRKARDFSAGMLSGENAAPVQIVGTSSFSVTNSEEGYELAGLLTVKRPDLNLIWVLCHGLCSDKNGNVPRFVSERIDTNTFRFDFGGCGDSGGDWMYAGYKRELSDLREVVLKLRYEGWDVSCLLGHSKGAAAVLHYGERYDDVPLIVNVAGRFNMSEMPRSRFTEEQWGLLETEGSFQWSVKGLDLTIRKQDLEERATLDMKRTAEAIKMSKVLTIHGTADDVIPVADAHDFDRFVGGGKGGCHELVVVEGAGHRFANPSDEDSVMEALSCRVPGS